MEMLSLTERYSLFCRENSKAFEVKAQVGAPCVNCVIPFENLVLDSYEANGPTAKVALQSQEAPSYQKAKQKPVQSV